MDRTDEAQITLEAHVCDRRRSYRVTFATEEQALGFIAARSSTHAFAELQDTPIPDDCTRLIAVLYPRCEHGLSLDLCDGPGHYPMDHPAYM